MGERIMQFTGNTVTFAAHRQPLQRAGVVAQQRVCVRQCLRLMPNPRRHQAATVAKNQQHQDKIQRNHDLSSQRWPRWMMDQHKADIDYSRPQTKTYDVPPAKMPRHKEQGQTLDWRDP